MMNGTDFKLTSFYPERAPRNAVINWLDVPPVVCDHSQPAEKTSALSGIPFAVKNNICLAGARLTCGSKMLENYRSPYSATAVLALEKAGAVPVCTANLDEFGMGSWGKDSAFGVPQNPGAPGCCTGGSSSGSAALVASGCVPLALASDTGGSARLPAAWCGVWGMKPSYGAFSRFGLTAYASSLEQIGLISRELSLLRAAHAALSCRKDPRDATHQGLPALKNAPFTVKNKKIAILEAPLSQAEPAISKAVLEAAGQFEKAGAQLHPVAFPLGKLLIPAYYVIACAEASANLARFTSLLAGTRMPGDTWEERFASSRSLLGKEVQKRISLGAYVLREGHYDHYYLRAQNYRKILRNWFASLFEECALLVLPVSLTAALPLDHQPSDPLASYWGDQLTACANLAGLPALSIPWGKDEKGRPAAVQLIAPAGQDQMLLEAAALLTE